MKAKALALITLATTAAYQPLLLSRPLEQGEKCCGNKTPYRDTEKTPLPSPSTADFRGTLAPAVAIYNDNINVDPNHPNIARRIEQVSYKDICCEGEVKSDTRKTVHTWDIDLQYKKEEETSLGAAGAYGLIAVIKDKNSLSFTLPQTTITHEQACTDEGIGEKKEVTRVHGIWTHPQPEITTYQGWKWKLLEGCTPEKDLVPKSIVYKLNKEAPNNILSTSLEKFEDTEQKTYSIVFYRDPYRDQNGNLIKPLPLPFSCNCGW